VKLYEPICRLADYAKEYAELHAIIQSTRTARGVTSPKVRDDLGTMTLQELNAARQKYKIRTVEERYPPNDSDPEHKVVDGLRGEIDGNPEKVKRLNQMAALANNCRDVATYKRAFNEVRRILYGKNAIVFDDPASNPDLLHPPT